jgi:hypothetical protein
MTTLLRQATEDVKPQRTLLSSRKGRFALVTLSPGKRDLVAGGGRNVYRLGPVLLAIVALGSCGRTSLVAPASVQVDGGVQKSQLPNDSPFAGLTYVSLIRATRCRTDRGVLLSNRGFQD